MWILHKKIGSYKFCSSNKTTPKNTTTLKKFPRKMWFRHGNNLTFKKKILFYCTFPEEEKEETNAIRDRKRQEHLITVNKGSICDGNC